MHSHYLLICGEAVLSWVVLQLLSPGLMQLQCNGGYGGSDKMTSLARVVPWRGQLEGWHFSLSPHVVLFI